jgi:predicted metal-dependent peptidase
LYSAENNMNIVDSRLAYLKKFGYKLRPRVVGGGEPVFTPIVYEYDLVRLSDNLVVQTWGGSFPDVLRQATFWVKLSKSGGK